MHYFGDFSILKSKRKRKASCHFERLGISTVYESNKKN